VLRKACCVVIGVAERIKKITALKRCVATEMRWNRNKVSCGSSTTVLVTVTFQEALRPSRHGTDVNPSGRFPSDLINPCGFLTGGMPTMVNERQIKSFNSGDAVLFQDCACKKMHGFHECNLCTWPSSVRGACQLQHVLHRQSEMGIADRQSPLSAAEAASSLAR